jgi:hypothetical protein
LANLTENNIKKATLRFLKRYYRYRPRLGPTELQLDQRGEGGIIADGYLSFKDENGAPFVATFEATSHATRHEVKYRLQRRLLFWDATAAGSILVTLAYGWLLYHDKIALHVIGLYEAILFSAAGVAGGHFLYRLFFSGLRRYRYIYAAEQFKRYHANDQWIAIGEDVFHGAEDPEFIELREQCIYNGFGLIVVDTELQPHIQIAPSRVDTFEQRRSAVNFFSLEELGRRLAAQEKLGQRLRDWLPFYFGRGEEEKLLRFRKSYAHQIIVCVACMLVTAGIFYREWQERDKRYVSSRRYTEIVAKNVDDQRREPYGGWIIDSAFLIPFQRDVRPYLSEEASPAPRTFPFRYRPGMVIYQGKGQFFDYDCERLLEENASIHVIVVELFGSADDLRLFIAAYQQKGLNAMGMWLGCFDPGKDEYALFLQQLYTSQEEAERDLAGLQNRLSRAGFPPKAEIMRIN